MSSYDGIPELCFNSFFQQTSCPFWWSKKNPPIFFGTKKSQHNFTSLQNKTPWATFLALRFNPPKTWCINAMRRSMCLWHWLAMAPLVGADGPASTTTTTTNLWEREPCHWDFFWGCVGGSMVFAWRVYGKKWWTVRINSWVFRGVESLEQMFKGLVEGSVWIWFLPVRAGTWVWV